MNLTILSYFMLVCIIAVLSGCTRYIQTPVYEPPKPVYVAKDTIRPVFTLKKDAGTKEKVEAIVHSYAQCEARVGYLEDVKAISSR